MGAYVTQSRIPRLGINVSSRKNGVLQGPKDLSEYSEYAGRQTTRSYRSGRAAVIADPFADEDQDLSEGQSNLAGATSALFGENDRPTISRSSYDNGHSFESTWETVEFSHVLRNWKIPVKTSDSWYSGPVVLDPFYFALGKKWLEPEQPDQGYYGPLAISRTAPTNPAAGLSVALAELRREGIPDIATRTGWAARTNDIRSRSSDTASLDLQVQFGLMPLLSEIKQAAKAVKNARALLDQFQRDSGKRIRRSYSFPLEHKVLSVAKGTGRVNLVSPYSSFATDAFVGGDTWGFQNESLTQERRVWFSGAYSYHAEAGKRMSESLWSIEQKMNHLFGTRVTPDVLWNLQPWSWLADWELNIGDNIANISALSNDGLVLVYGYLMAETTTRHTITVEGPDLKDHNLPTAFSQTFVKRRKERFKATPYGFGLNPDSFTDRQWAILGALGLTKSTRTLR